MTMTNKEARAWVYAQSVSDQEAEDVLDALGADPSFPSSQVPAPVVSVVRLKCTCPSRSCVAHPEMQRDAAIKAWIRGQGE